MCQVRAEVAVGHGPRHGVTVDAGSRFEYSLSLGSSISRGCRLALLLNPTIEVSTRLHVDPQQHFGVLCPAILGALTEVDARLMGINPHAVRVVGNQVSFARQTRNPEAVIRIRRQQLDKRRGWVTIIANRYM